jgi:hypothetical protein
MAAPNPYEFVTSWTRENVHATAFDDKVTARNHAAECLRDAKKAGFREEAIIKAAGGNLEGHMLSELDSAANQEANRLASKRD